MSLRDALMLARLTWFAPTNETRDRLHHRLIFFGRREDSIRRSTLVAGRGTKKACVSQFV